MMLARGECPLTLREAGMVSNKRTPGRTSPLRMNKGFIYLLWLMLVAMMLIVVCVGNTIFGKKWC